MHSDLQNAVDELIMALGKLGGFEESTFSDGRRVVAEAREHIMTALIVLTSLADMEGTARDS